MRQDQFEKMQTLHERLTDLFLDEADPQKWPGIGIDLAAMDKQTRGDRYWSKKNAVATIALMQRIQSLVDVVRERSAGGEDAPTAVTDPQEDLDAEVDAAEKEAKRVLARMQDPAAKAEFDRRIHGKT